MSGSIIKIYDEVTQEWTPILVGAPGPIGMTGPTGPCCNTGPTVEPEIEAVVTDLNLTVDKLGKILIKEFSEETENYTLSFGDDERIIEMNVSTANEVTVPTDNSQPFYSGFRVDIIQTGSGQTSIVPASGVIIYSANDWRKINARYGAVTLIKKAEGYDEWFLFGNLAP